MSGRTTPCRASNFGIGDNSERTEGRNHFNHDREGERQAESNISHCEKTSGEPRPELADWIGGRGTAAVAKGVDGVAQDDRAFFKALRLESTH
jgi:hypothetical protein